MSFTSQPRKYDLGEIAYFAISPNALNTGPITNESGTWIPASSTQPILGTKLTAPQRAYLHSIQNPTTGSNIVGIGFGQGTATYNTVNLNVCNMPSTFDNGTPPKIGSTFMLNLSHGVPSGNNANPVINNVLTEQNIFEGRRIGQTLSSLIAPDNNGACVLITTNPANTAFCLLTVSSGNNFLVFTSTDGINWTQQSITNHIGGTFAWAQSIGTGAFGPMYTNGVRCGMGYHITMPIIENQNGIPMIYVNCGARIVNTVYDSSNNNIKAYRTTNGFDFNGEESLAVLGAQNLNQKVFFFHRNGNSCFLICGNTLRFTTDGGVTWATSTMSTFFNATSYTFIQTNATNRTSLIASNTGNTTIQVSTDTGASWTQRTLPALGGVGASLAYAGSTIVFLSNTGTVHRSTDNGANWTQIANTTLGVGANPINVVHDGYRFYMLYQGGLGVLSTSTNGITWTARTIPPTTLTDTTSYYNTFNPSSSITQSAAVTNAAAANSSDVIITTASTTGQRAIMSNDGGVTWYVASNVAASTYSLYALNSTFFRDLVYVEPTGSTSSTRGFITGNMFIPEQHVDNLGHRFVGNPGSVTNSTLSNQTAFIKIG